MLFISDERSARQWLWNFLATPQSYSDIYTAYVKALQTSEDELPELRTMLEEGFIPVGSQWRRPDVLAQAELERRRQERLLHQFAEYLATAKGGRPLKEVRKEALVAGFTEPIAPAATPTSWPWAASCPSGCWRTVRISTISWISRRRRWRGSGVVTSALV